MNSCGTVRLSKTTVAVLHGVSLLIAQQRYTLRRENLRITAATRHARSPRYPLRPDVEQ